MAGGGKRQTKHITRSSATGSNMSEAGMAGHVGPVWDERLVRLVNEQNDVER